MSDQASDDHRVAFDFEITFSNGGGISGWDFRLDIEGDDISDEALGDHIVADLRLLMVGSVVIKNKRVFKERHKRGTVAAPAPASTRDAPGARRLVDLSHAVRDGQETYRGFPAPSIRDHLGHADTAGRYAPGVTFQIGRIDMVANTGTAIDAPYHRYPGMADVADLPLAATADLEGALVNLAGMAGRAVTKQALLPALGDVSGKAVLIHTGWSAHWGSERYFDGHAFIAGEAAEWLRAQGAALVGIDSLNIDDTGDPTRPAHTILLGAGIPIVENLTGLDALPLTGFRFSGAPMRARGMGAFPIRAWAAVG